MQFPTAPAEPMHGHDFSQVRDVPHSRQESTPPTKAGRTPLRSSLSRTGPKNKQHKRVSWQV
jgi:hypothetical protein